jgi:hypothetical protein
MVSRYGYKQEQQDIPERFAVCTARQLKAHKITASPISSGLQLLTRITQTIYAFFTAVDLAGH